MFSNLIHFQMGIRVMWKVFIDYSYSLTASRIIFVRHILGILANIKYGVNLRRDFSVSFCQSM